MSCDNVTEVAEELQRVKSRFADLKRRAIQRAKFEGLDQSERLQDPNDRFFNKLEEFALYKLAYYACFMCKGAFFGGIRDCEQELEH